MIVSESQKQKALFPIVMTLFGIFMLMRDLHDSKAPSPIFVTLFGILIQVSDLHSVYLQHIVIQQVLIKTIEK